MTRYVKTFFRAPNSKFANTVAPVNVKDFLSPILVLQDNPEDLLVKATLAKENTADLLAKVADISAT